MAAEQDLRRDRSEIKLQYNLADFSSYNQKVHGEIVRNGTSTESAAGEWFHRFILAILS